MCNIFGKGTPACPLYGETIAVCIHVDQAEYVDTVKVGPVVIV